MRKHYKAVFLFSILLVGAFLVGCSNESGTPEATEQAESASHLQLKTPVTVEDSIEYAMREPIMRLRYQDKSGLYENEFEYYRVENNFDQYLKTGQMEAAKADSLIYMEIVGVTLFEHDSAEVDMYFHFDQPVGEHHKKRDTITVYYHNGRWIKPTVSKLKNQLEYEKTQGKGN